MRSATMDGRQIAFGHAHSALSSVLNAARRILWLLCGLPSNSLRGFRTVASPCSRYSSRYCTVIVQGLRPTSFRLTVPVETIITVGIILNDGGSGGSARSPRSKERLSPRIMHATQLFSLSAPLCVGSEWPSLDSPRADTLHPLRDVAVARLAAVRACA